MKSFFTGSRQDVIDPAVLSPAALRRFFFAFLNKAFPVHLIQRIVESAVHQVFTGKRVDPFSNRDSVGFLFETQYGNQHDLFQNRQFLHAVLSLLT